MAAEIRTASPRASIPPMSTPSKLRARLLEHALSFPEAREDHPWGESVAKVRTKVFVFFGRAKPDGPLEFALKLPQSGTAVLDRGLGEPTGYGLGKSGWVTLQLYSGHEASWSELCKWVEESYRAVAPKTLVKNWDAGPSSSSPSAKAPRTSAVGRSAKSRSGKSGPRTKSRKPR
jgi:predicted DNA-binding protein (MmcQ/YjbR family)